MRNGKAKGANQRRAKGNDVKTFFSDYRMNASKRALYRKTRDALAAMPRSTAIDLGMFPEDAAKIAYKAVWG